MKKIFYFIFLSLTALSFLISQNLSALQSPITKDTIQDFNKPLTGPKSKGEVSFNGKANVVKCLSATNLGDEVKGQDMKYKKKVCVTNPGNAKERCFMEEQGAKAPVKDGQNLISTGKNNGSDSSFKIANIFNPSDVTDVKSKSAKPEMEIKEEKSCCTKFGKKKGKKICIQTKGQKVKEFGQLKAGQNFGNTEQPPQGGSIPPPPVTSFLP